jgi:predicted DNA-binding transcriptional regulator AlpA
MTPDEVAALTRTTVDTLRWYRYVGKGPRSFKVGRRVRYDRTAVLAWIERERERTASGDDVA